MNMIRFRPPRTQATYLFVLFWCFMCQQRCVYLTHPAPSKASAKSSGGAFSSMTFNSAATYLPTLKFKQYCSYLTWPYLDCRFKRASKYQDHLWGKRMLSLSSETAQSSSLDRVLGTSSLPCWYGLCVATKKKDYDSFSTLSHPEVPDPLRWPPWAP